LAQIEDMYESSRLTFDEHERALRQGYAFSGRRKDKFPQYVVDAGRFGHIEGFDYDDKGKKRIITTVHKLFNAQYGAS
jgi:hypothetical protein